ncbi:MAG: cytochrome P450 [Acidobacteria bacterium]|nr:cytochrome P450 [Acidobacteriota bacterium]
MENFSTILTSHDTYLDGVPHEVFQELRAHDPVAWTEEPDGRGFWSITKYDDVLYVSRHTELFSSRFGIRMEDMDDEETEARRTLMEMDSPEHTRLRRIVARPFTPRQVAEYEGAIRDLAREVLANLDGAREFDFVKEIARELPMKMLGRLLGLPDEDLDWLVSRGDALIGNTDPEFTDYVVDQTDTSAYRLLPFRSPVALELFEYAQAALDARRITPTHDVITALLQPTSDGDTLDDVTLKNFFTLMVAAGNDTTRYTMVAGTQVFIERPELFGQLPHFDESQMKLLVDEVLRWSSTTMHFRRTVVEDTELHGQQLKKGDKVVLWYVSANYDESHFEDPYSFLADRSPNDHTAFGLHSAHLCLGAHLARLELRVMFEEMAKAWSSIELAGDTERLRSNFISGTKRLPIRVTWR